MTDTDTYLPFIETIEQQWSSLSVQNLSISTVDSSVLVSGQQSFTIMDEAVTYTAIASHGMTDRSLNLIYIATIPGAQVLTNGLYAFLLQSTALMPPLEFIVDLQSDQLLIRQSQVVSRNYHIQSESFAIAAQWLIPKLIKAADQIAHQELQPADARKMADFLSESYFEELADD